MMRRWSVWTAQAIHYVGKIVNLPQVVVPSPNEDAYDDDAIEWIAKECRRLWGLADGPIANMEHYRRGGIRKCPLQRASLVDSEQVFVPPNKGGPAVYGSPSAKKTPTLPPSMQKLVVILGTNASGKSDLGIRLAKHLDGEIVSADSRQVYRGLDLGTGKITPAQAGTVKHHLIDVAEVSDYFSLAQYQRGACGAIAAIAEAGKLPLLVGGTGLYISAMVEGYQLVDVPPNDPLRTELERLPLAQLVARLEKADPEAARRIDKSNQRRLIRAIEIASAGRAHTAAHKRSPQYNCLQLGLTWPREILAARIDKRLRERLANGMLDEVAGLRSRGVSDTRLEKLGLEYRYITQYLRGELGTLDDLRLQLGTAIRQFAKGQLTWFKRDSRIIWLDPFSDYFQEACDRIREWEGRLPMAP